MDDSRPSVSRFGVRQASDGLVVCASRSDGYFSRSGGRGLWWRHLEMSSERRLSVLSLLVIMATFSSRHRLHIPLFRLKVLDFFIMSHLIS